MESNSINRALISMYRAEARPLSAALIAVRVSFIPADTAADWWCNYLLLFQTFKPATFFLSAKALAYRTDLRSGLLDFFSSSSHSDRDCMSRCNVFRASSNGNVVNSGVETSRMFCLTISLQDLQPSVPILYCRTYNKARYLIRHVRALCPSGDGCVRGWQLTFSGLPPLSMNFSLRVWARSLRGMLKVSEN